MHKIIFAVLLLCIGIIEARSLQKRQTVLYVLPSGAEEIVGDIVTTFQCADKLYGYYADVDNGCKIFHICHPQTLADGHVEMFAYSFFCPNTTVFDQETLVCAYPGDAIPCPDAPLFYLINENFGLQVWHTTPRPVPGYSDRQRKKREESEESSE